MLLAQCWRNTPNEFDRSSANARQYATVALQWNAYIIVSFVWNASAATPRLIRGRIVQDVSRGQQNAKLSRQSFCA